MKNKIFAVVAAALSMQCALAADYQHIRNATAKIRYGGQVFLVDPYLAKKGTHLGFAGTVNNYLRNPLIDMHQSTEEVVDGVDALILTHTHPDHWDEAAQRLIRKDIPVFVQNAGDAVIVRNQGFRDVRVVRKNTPFGKVKISRTGGQHGSDEMYSTPALAEFLGDAMGVVLQADGEKTLYLVGDTVWTHDVDHALQHYRPDVVVMNTGAARLEGMDGSIIMRTAEVKKLYQTAPQAQIIAVHMDAVNHATVSSNDMRQFIRDNRLQDRVHVPKEGENLRF